MASDVRIASRDAKFSAAFVRLGLTGMWLQLLSCSDAACCCCGLLFCSLQDWALHDVAAGATS